MLAAEPKGQSRAARNWRWTRLPTSAVRAPPIRSGTTNMPIVGMNTRMVPATTPGRLRGSVIRQNARAGRAYRSEAASSRWASIFSNDV